MDPNFSGGRGESPPTYSGYGDISMSSAGCMLDGVYSLCRFLDNTESLALQVTNGRQTKVYPITTSALGILSVEHQGKRLSRKPTPVDADISEGEIIVTNTETDDKLWFLELMPFDSSQKLRDPRKNMRRLTTARVQEIRRILTKTLDDNPECKNYMSRFLAEIGRVTGVRPFSTNIVNVFDRLAKLGHVFSTRNTGALAWGGGSAGTGSGSIFFDFDEISKDDSILIPVTLHELTHAAPGIEYAGYSHEAMDRAAYNLLKKNDPNVGPFNKNGRYYANYLEAHCVHSNQ